MSAVVVMVAYKPKPGKTADLHILMREHYGILKEQGLVTGRLPILMEAGDGSIIEVFEWASADAIERAHSNPVVGQMWARFADACDYVPISQVPEAATLFSSFTPFS